MLYGSVEGCSRVCWVRCENHAIFQNLKQTISANIFFFLLHSQSAFYYRVSPPHFPRFQNITTVPVYYLVFQVWNLAKGEPKNCLHSWKKSFKSLKLQYLKASNLKINKIFCKEWSCITSLLADKRQKCLQKLFHTLLFYHVFFWKLVTGDLWASVYLMGKKIWIGKSWLLKWQVFIVKHLQMCVFGHTVAIVQKAIVKNQVVTGFNAFT